MLFAIILSVALVAVDHLFKYLAVQYLLPIGAVTVIPGVVELRYVENTGASFSLFAGRQAFLLIVTGIALAVWAVFVFFKRPKNKWEHLGLILVFAGGVGNFIDRAAQGYVVDYICPLFVNFAVFNFADICITGGFAVLVVAIIVGEAKNSKAAKAAALAEAAGDGVADGKTETGAGEADEAKADAPAAESKKADDADD